MADDSDIEEALERFRQWVREQKDRSTPLGTVFSHYPWDVPVELDDVPNAMMRDHAVYVATGGEEMPTEVLARLKAWYAMLWRDNVVLEFDPGIPPIDGVSTTGGWAYRPHEPSDRHLIIRVNQHTRMTPEGDSIWTFPPDDDLERS